MPTSIIGRAVALVAGVIFTAGALAILLEEVVLGSADFALKHGLTVVIVSGTMLTGHLVVEAWRSRHFLGALGFAVLFLTGTALVVYKSTGRQAEHTFASEADAGKLAKTLADKGADLEAARQRKRDADAQVDWEIQGRPDKRGRPTVKPGCGKNCEDWKKRATEVQSHIEKLEREIAELGPQKTPVPEAENFANIAAVFGFEKEKVKAAAVLVEPFIQTVLFELGGIWCLGFAFRHRKTATRETKAATVAHQPRQPLPSETAQTDFYADDLEATRATIIGDDEDDTDGRNGGNSGNRFSPKGGNGGGNRQAFEADVLTRLALGQTIARQDDLALAHGVNKGTVSKWLKDMRRRDLIPAAQRVGRCHRLVAESENA